jgi:tRNA (guanine-N(7)-)-methyltransferase subunit TRM82
MPKRPCAIDLASRDQTIIIGDKFGDVYSLPLFPKLYQENAEQTSVSAPHYKPTATEKTVHSKSNLRVLQEQLKQAEQGGVTKSKGPIAFEHELLLGHVSMLTDLVVASHKAEDKTEKARTYILTADRDEHIRISRGPPQAFVTEGYCLGHREFVSKICLLDPKNLVSGGGDDEIFLWNWLEGKLLGKFEIRNMVLQILNEAIRLRGHQHDAGEVPQNQKLAVSGMWTFPDSGISKVRIWLVERFNTNPGKPQVLVAFEGVPALISITLNPEKAGSQQPSILKLPGNVLDVAFVSDQCMVVSVDNIHRPGTTTDIDDSDEPDESEASKVSIHFQH